MYCIAHESIKLIAQNDISSMSTPAVFVTEMNKWLGDIQKADPSSRVNGGTS